MDLELEWPPQMVEKSLVDDVQKEEPNLPRKFILSRSFRLRPFEFKRPMTHKVHTKHLMAIYRLAEPSSKIGISLSKRKVPLSVTRNRIKRQAKESFRYHQRPLPNAHILIVATKNTNQASRDEINQCLKSLWKKIIHSA